MKNAINPPHYKTGETELINYTRSLPFSLGNVVKYIFRAGVKAQEPLIQDLVKAKWYAKDFKENPTQIINSSIHQLDDRVSFLKLTHESPYYKQHLLALIADYIDHKGNGEEILVELIRQIELSIEANGN